MLGFGRPFILLLIINFLDLSFVSSSSSQNATRPRGHPSGENYDQYEDFTTEPPSSSSTNSEYPDLNPCDYDMCVEQQHTCQELRDATGCLCPGLSNIFTRPSPPRLSYLTQKGSKEVLVHWCAPTSFVTHYIVWVSGKSVNKNIHVEERKRDAVMEDVEAGARICVQAVNKGGVSADDDQSCDTFEPQNTDTGLALKLGIIGGVAGLILLLILALLLWRHKSRQKSSARTKTEGVL
ncbi:LRRN4 C-terminal-like protein [Puntigrus tetrazona]|uniref:LRRN4 C-terminal-like protein n=1 Tax=Puntigrus tetrazona TaxID=1606681 RepID=UPI001C8B07EB|nr:LRRN4 C-terminal-like protein [Puntigrus tetrazona]XP_043094095.1 LRRN4 C-terminal-like protein [Puntigrus tetrazona]